MSSKVKVNMRTCSKTTLVTAELMEDGTTVKIKIASDCQNVKNYAKLLGDRITMDDCIDYTKSRVFADDVRIPLSLPCLVPSAIMNAAWLELGMMTKSCAKNAGTNDNEFLIDD